MKGDSQKFVKKKYYVIILQYNKDTNIFLSDIQEISL